MCKKLIPTSLGYAQHTAIVALNLVTISGLFFSQKYARMHSLQK